MSEYVLKDANDTAAAAIAEGRDPREALRDRIAKRKPARAVAEDDRTPAERPVMVCMADVKSEPVRWLWPLRIALGKLTVIAGDPNLGKSFITLDLAARVSTGSGWPDDSGYRTEPGGVVLLSAEDDVADTIRPRLDAAQAAVERISVLQAVERFEEGTGRLEKCAFTLADVDALEEAIHKTGDCRLVVVDPISAYMGRTDSHVNAEVRAVLAPLSELAARRGVAVVAVTHLRKGDGPAIYRAMGSLAFVAAARAAYGVIRDPEDTSGERRLFLTLKNNLAPDRSGLAYRLTVPDGGTMPVVDWEPDPVTVNPDDLFAMVTRRRGPVPVERTEAEAWLQTALSGGPQPAADLFREAEAVGISGATLRRAKTALACVRAQKSGYGNGWTWELIEDAHVSYT